MTKGIARTITNIHASIIKVGYKPHFDAGHFVFGKHGHIVAVQAKRYRTDMVLVALPQEFLNDLHVYMDATKWRSEWDYRKTFNPCSPIIVITDVKTPESEKWTTAAAIEIARRHDGLIISCNLNDLTKCDGSFNKGYFGLFDIFVPEREIRRNAKKLFQYSNMVASSSKDTKITQFADMPQAANE